MCAALCARSCTRTSQVWSAQGFTHRHRPILRYALSMLLPGSNHHNYSNLFQNSIITMQLEDTRGQVLDEPVSFVCSFHIVPTYTFGSRSAILPSYGPRVPKRAPPTLCDHNAARLYIRAYLLHATTTMFVRIQEG